MVIKELGFVIEKCEKELRENGERGVLLKEVPIILYIRNYVYGFYNANDWI